MIVGLPYRFLSPDGFCAIDIVSKPGATSERASLWEVKQGAFACIAKCVQGNPSTGGIARNIGNKNKLAVIVRSYAPKVQCASSPGTAPILGSCSRLLDTV